MLFGLQILIFNIKIGNLFSRVEDLRQGTHLRIVRFDDEANERETRSRTEIAIVKPYIQLLAMHSQT